MSTITITDPQEFRKGDQFIGTIGVVHPNGTLSSTTAAGKLETGSAHSGKLWIVIGLPYVTDTRWYDVTVTREVPGPPTIREQVDALKPGTRFTVPNSGGGIYTKLATRDRVVSEYMGSTYFISMNRDATRWSESTDTIEEVTE
jgi:hypothetical protein